MRKIIFAVAFIVCTVSVFGFEGEITVRYKGKAETKEDYTLTFHVGGGKSRVDFLYGETGVKSVFLPQGGDKVIIYNLNDTRFFNSTISDIPSVEEYKIQETSETKTISGYACTKYIFKSFTGKTVESWIAKNLSMNWSSIPNVIRMLPEARIMAKYDILGVPMETIIVDETGVLSKSTLVAVKQQTPAAIVFQLPAGYTEAK